MKYKNPSLFFVRTDGQTQSNMPLRLFQSSGHKKGHTEIIVSICKSIGIQVIVIAWVVRLYVEIIHEL